MALEIKLIPFLLQQKSLSLSQNQVPDYLKIGIKWEFGVNPKLSPQL